MFMVLSSWQNHYESSPGSFDECGTAPSVRRPSDQAKPNDFGCESACRLLQSTPTIAIYYYYSARADTHFTIPQKVDSRVDMGGWLHTEMVYPPTDGHQSSLTESDVVQLHVLDRGQRVTTKPNHQSDVLHDDAAW